MYFNLNMVQWHTDRLVLILVLIVFGLTVSVFSVCSLAAFLFGVIVASHGHIQRRSNN